MTKNSKESKQGGKKKQGPKLKNVLAYPFPQYWPALNADQTESLQNLVLNLKQKTNGNQIVHNKTVMIGLSKILREINQNKKVYFFLSTDIKPKFVATQIVNLTLSKYKLCKVLCVPNSKDLTKLLFGIESIAFGFKGGECPAVEKWIEDVQKKYFPVPEKILSYYTRGIDHSKDILKQNITKNNEEMKGVDSVDVTTFYLKRDVIHQRAFIPPNADLSKPKRLDELDMESTEWTDFISLSVNSNSRTERMEVDNNDEDDDDHDDDTDIEYEKEKLAHNIRMLISKTTNGNTDSHSMRKQSDIQTDIGKLKENVQQAKPKKKHKKSNKLEYIGLTVNRIQPNPDKIRKKKKKNK